jgi:glycosyltransferase involved in cell wall biosynthesis
MKVAIYTIALNEEQFVERWYESAKDADYLMIADTGSTDKTVELAKSLGINVEIVKISPWRFDDARNAALALLPIDIDYCISLDMDEIITPNWREALQVAYDNGWTRPKYKHIWSWNEDGTPGLEFSYDHIHTRKNYRWRHPVHECLYVYGRDETSGWLEGLETHHHPDPTKSRAQYLPLLAMSVQEDPTSDRNVFYYARELYFHGQYKLAMEEFKRHLSLPTATWDAERAASMRYLGKITELLMNDGEIEHDKAAYWFNRAIEEAPGRREPYVDLAKHYYIAEKWEECLQYAKGAIEIVEKPLEYLCEPEAWGHAPYDYAAISAFKLGKFDDAKIYGTIALQLKPDDERLAQNLSFYALAASPTS